MTEEPQAGSTGAPFHGVTDWHAIDWKAVNLTVRRLQARIVKATQEKRWGKVKALQRLLTHSFSGKAVAVRRVTENQGKYTPGVDKITWTTPHKKINAVYALRQRGYQPQPLRRIYIPKKNGKQRPLGIPIWAAHCLSFQAMFGIPYVFLLVDRNLRSTILVLLYHKLPQYLSVSLLPLPFDRLAQGGNDLWRERNPAWSQRCGANTLQDASFAPIRDSRDIDMEQVCGGASRVASISPLPRWGSFWSFWASSRDVIG
jgi:N-terminal domain of reverse transcriptase